MSPLLSGGSDPTAEPQSFSGHYSLLIVKVGEIKLQSQNGETAGRGQGPNFFSFIQNKRGGKMEREPLNNIGYNAEDLYRGRGIPRAT